MVGNFFKKIHKIIRLHNVEFYQGIGMKASRLSNSIFHLDRIDRLIYLLSQAAVG